MCLNYSYGEEKKNLQLELRSWERSYKESERKYGHVCVRFFLAPVPTCPLARHDRSIYKKMMYNATRLKRSWDKRT